MNCLFYSYSMQGIYIKDTITDNCIHYIGYSLKAAIQQHRKTYNLKYKHFRLIKI